MTLAGCRASLFARVTVHVHAAAARYQPAGSDTFFRCTKLTANHRHKYLNGTRWLWPASRGTASSPPLSSRGTQQAIAGKGAERRHSCALPIATNCLVRSRPEVHAQRYIAPVALAGEHCDDHLYLVAVRSAQTVSASTAALGALAFPAGPASGYLVSMRPNAGLPGTASRSSAVDCRELGQLEHAVTNSANTTAVITKRCLRSIVFSSSLEVADALHFDVGRPHAR